MSEPTTLFDDDWATVDFDEDLYPKDAVYGAAYVFLDRCYIVLDRAAEGRVRVRLRAKQGGAADTRAAAGELQNELLAQAYRRRLAHDNRVMIEAITARAIAGAAGPPGLDELLAMEIGEGTAFEDPLGIAMSWDEKYKKKAEQSEQRAPATGPEPPAPATGPDDEGQRGPGSPT